MIQSHKPTAGGAGDRDREQAARRGAALPVGSGVVRLLVLLAAVLAAWLP